MRKQLSEIMKQDDEPNVVGGTGPYAPKDITIYMDDFPEATIISDGVKYTVDGSGEDLELVRKDDEH